MSAYLPGSFIFFVPVGLVCALLWYFRPSTTLRYPPGPRGYPIIGNLLSFPLAFPWKHLAKLTEHGDIIYYHGLGNSVLVLNSMESIRDLLIHKGNVYTSRPYVTVACELMDLIHSTAVLPFGPRWKLHRKLLKIGFNTTKLKQFDDTVYGIVDELIEALRRDPDNFTHHIRLASGKVLLKTVYGISGDPETEEQYVTLAKGAQKVASKSLVPFAFAMDLIPPLKYLQKWTPYFSSYKMGLEGRRAVAECIGKPFFQVKRDVKAGLAKPSFTSNALTEDDFAKLREREVNYESELRWLSGTMFVGGQELISGHIAKIVYAMVTNPDKLKIAQEELKRVIGSRSPTIEDRNRCPYVHAIVKETLRFENSAPLGLFRASIQDDYYRGYFIPKNTIVVPNGWAVAYAPDDEYPPDTFAPERFLRDQPSIDPSSYIFGFGRRICPGVALAEDAMFLMAANILMAFDIVHKVDSNGQEIPIQIKYTESTGLFIVPSSFECAFKPRVDVGDRRF